MDLEITKTEEQSQADIDFSWTVIEFTKDQMIVQLDFANIYSISRGEDPNYLEVYIWNADFFRRETDGVKIQEKTVMIQVLPKQIEASNLTESVKALGKNAASTAKGGFTLVVVVSFATGFSMNQVLSQVNNL